MSFKTVCLLMRFLSDRKNIILVAQLVLEIVYAVSCIALLYNIFMTDYKKEMDRLFDEWAKKMSEKITEKWFKENAGTAYANMGFDFLVQSICVDKEKFKEQSRYEVKKKRRLILLFIILSAARQGLIWYAEYHSPWF